MASGVKGCGISLPTGDIRNDLYLTLEKGDFERGGKSVQKNIEVTMYVLYADGEILKVRLASQSFGLEDNPIIILCGLYPEAHSLQAGLKSPHQPFSLPFSFLKKTLKCALIMTSSIVQPLWKFILVSDLNPSCSILDLFPLVLSYMLPLLPFHLA